MPSACATLSPDLTERHLYEYAVVQYVPDIERGEFVNIGLVMMCKRRRWICSQFFLNRPRISALFPDTDFDLLSRQIAGFESVSAGDTSRGNPIAALEPHERFRWLTAVRSACLQTSRPHAGLTGNLSKTFDTLFDTFIPR